MWLYSDCHADANDGDADDNDDHEGGGVFPIVVMVMDIDYVHDDVYERPLHLAG